MALTNAERQARYRANLKAAAEKGRMYDALGHAERYMRWQANPCGKPPLDLSGLTRFAEFQGREPCLSVQTPRRVVGRMRADAVRQLAAAYHWNRDFPGELLGYYEGPHRDDASVWVIMIYGKGEAWPVNPEPPRPDFLG